MNLIIDIGNTQAKAAVFLEEKLIALKIFKGEPGIAGLKNFLKNQPAIKSAILCSVINHSPEVNKFLKISYKFIELNEKSGLPVKNLYKTPGTLGTDRIATAAGANYLFPGRNVLAIDAGTCIKYDFVNSKNEYLGGAISPGLDMRFKALHSFTAHLPLIKKIKAGKKNLVGQTTKDSIRSGVQNGVIAEISGIINQYRNKFEDVSAILTGGDSVFINTIVSKKNRIFAVPDLTLLGLNIILNFNNETI